MAKRAMEIYEAGGKKFDEADIATLFEETAAKASEAKDMSGTTATCIFLRREEVSKRRSTKHNTEFSNLALQNGEIDLYIAWVGDSRGIICKSDKLIAETIDHKLTNPSEKERVLKATNNKVMVLTPPTPSPSDAKTPLTPPKLYLGEAANPGTNKSKGKVRGIKDAESEDITVKGGGIYHKLKVEKSTLAKPREGRTDSDDSEMEDVTVKGGNAYRKRSEPNMRNPQDPIPFSPELGRAPSNQKPNPNDARRGSFIAQRITANGSQKGAWCLFSGVNGTSLAVTRSLGDADAAKSCIAVPEVKVRSCKVPSS